MTAETKIETETAQATGSCCSPNGSCHDGTAEPTTGSVTTVYAVTGMTCGHCEGAVSGEISAIKGVTSVKAEAATGRVTVISEAPIDEGAVRAAVDEAGYELTGQA